VVNHISNRWVMGVDEIGMKIRAVERDVGILEREVEEIKADFTTARRDLEIEMKSLGSTLSEVAQIRDETTKLNENIARIERLENRIEDGLEKMKTLEKREKETKKNLEMLFTRVSLTEVWENFRTAGDRINRLNDAIMSIGGRVRHLLLLAGAKPAEIEAFSKSFELQDILLKTETERIV
jgi:chromosome segregation ATPase